MAGSAADQTVCLLLRLGQVAFRMCEDRLGGLDLRVRHYILLQTLADEGPTAQLTLGEQLRIDPATMVSSLESLERRGCVERSRDPRDRRRYVVALTDSGRRILTLADERLHALSETVFADLADADRGALHRALAVLAAGPAMPAAFDQLRVRTVPHPASER
jgi:DNA-binding MarR family transcriptional regulator